MPIMLETDEKLNMVWWLMRIGLGVGLVVAGLDKFFGVLATWSQYLSPAAEQLLPLGPDGLVRLGGLVQLAVGGAILTRWTRAGAYAMSTWAAAMALNLALAGHFWELVMGQLEVSLAAFALARLSAWRTATIANYSPPLVPPGAFVVEERT